MQEVTECMRIKILLTRKNNKGTRQITKKMTTVIAFTLLIINVDWETRGWKIFHEVQVKKQLA